MWPETEETFTISPPPCWRMMGTTACMHSMAPNRLVSNIWRHWARFRADTASFKPNPALLTRISMRLLGRLLPRQVAGAKNQASALLGKQFRNLLPDSHGGPGNYSYFPL